MAFWLIPLFTLNPYSAFTYTSIGIFCFMDLDISGHCHTCINVEETVLKFSSVSFICHVTVCFSLHNILLLVPAKYRVAQKIWHHFYCTP